MRKIFSHGEKWEKKFSQWDSHWEMRKKYKNIYTCFLYEFIAQMASSRPRTNLFTDKSNYKGIGQLTDHLIDSQCQEALLQNVVPAD